MASAEQGGNHEQRVFFVGGPKHGEYMNLPAGQEDYEFTSMKSLGAHGVDGWGNWPESASHIYKLDAALTKSKAFPRGVFIFTHEVLWNSPMNGGMNLHAVRNAERALEKAQTNLVAVGESLQKANKDVGDLRAENIELTDELSTTKTRLRNVRVELESFGTNLWHAVSATGLDYESPWKSE